MTDPRTDAFITPTQFLAAIQTDAATDLGNLRAAVAVSLAQMEVKRVTSVTIDTSIYQSVNITSVASELQQAGWTVTVSGALGQLIIALPGK